MHSLMTQHAYPIRLSDLPREQRLNALYRRSAEARAQWQASRSKPRTVWERLFGD